MVSFRARAHAPSEILLWLACYFDSRSGPQKNAQNKGGPWWLDGVPAARPHRKKEENIGEGFRLEVTVPGGWVFCGQTLAGCFRHCGEGHRVSLGCLVLQSITRSERDKGGGVEREGGSEGSMCGEGASASPA